MGKKCSDKGGKFFMVRIMRLASIEEKLHTQVLCIKIATFRSDFFTLQSVRYRRKSTKKIRTSFDLRQTSSPSSIVSRLDTMKSLKTINLVVTMNYNYFQIRFLCNDFIMVGICIHTYIPHCTSLKFIVTTTKLHILFVIVRQVQF